MRVARNTAIYFAIAFGAGFALGLVRVPLLVPAVGERAAVLLEAPVLLAVIVLAARWLVRRGRGSRGEFALVGGLAALLVLSADWVVGVGVRGLSPAEVVTSRDPVAGGVYYALVLLFAAMPWLMSGSRSSG